MQIQINRTDRLSVYKQIAEQIKSHISRGELPAGTRLPTVRHLASQLGVTRITTHNAYSELQADGWIETVVGRGSFVSNAVKPQALEDDLSGYLTPGGAMHEIFQHRHIGGIRSMAMAYPDETTFPVDEFWSHITPQRDAGPEIFAYSDMQGHPGLRQAIATLLGSKGIHVTAGDITITNGTLHAISLIAGHLCTDGDAVLIEQPSFLGFINALEQQRLVPVGVPLDDDGVDLDALENAIRQTGARLYFTVPNFHNPTGICMSLPKREALLDLTRRYGVTVVEDDAYGELWYDRATPPPLRALDDDVIYISGFSKVLMPGIRVGFIVSHDQELLSIRRATDLGSPVILQQALAGFLDDHGLRRHLQRIRPLYRERRDVLLASLRESMPADVRWSDTEGGFATWLSFPRRFRPGELYARAIENGMAFTPGEAYRLPDEDYEHLRLCFGNQTTAAIQACVSTLAEIIQQKG